jgi:hypothetical protein
LSQKNKQNKQKIKFLAVAQAAWSSTVGPEVTCRPRQQQPREEKKSRGIGYLPPHTKWRLNKSLAPPSFPSLAALQHSAEQVQASQAKWKLQTFFLPSPCSVTLRKEREWVECFGTRCRHGGNSPQSEVTQPPLICLPHCS